MPKQLSQVSPALGLLGLCEDVLDVNHCLLAVLCLVLSQSDGLPSLTDGSGNNLICLEGMAPLGATRQSVVTTSATPTSSTTTAVMDLRAERLASGSRILRTSF